MSEKKCWACTSPLKQKQKICLGCQSWQDWRKFINISNTSIALVIALISVISLVGSRLLDLYSDLFPTQEVNITGHFDSNNQSINLRAYNFGDVPANLGSNIRCIFGLEDAMGNEDRTGGTEVEFWTTGDRIAQPAESLPIEYAPQTLDFDTGQHQALCFGALNYLGTTNHTEFFFLVIVPNGDHIWWPIESLFTTQDAIEELYPREYRFQR